MHNTPLKISYLISIWLIITLFISCGGPSSPRINQGQLLDSLFEQIKLSKQPKKAIPQLQQLIKENQTDSSILSRAYFYLSYCLLKNKQDSASFEVAQKALNILPLSEKNGAQAATIFYWMGYLEKKKAQYYAATYYYTQAAYLIDAGNLKLSFPKSSGIILLWASQLNSFNNRLDLSNRFARKMLFLLKKDTSMLAKDLSISANLLLSLGYLDQKGLANDSVRFYLNQATEIKKKTKLARIDYNYYISKAKIFYEGKELDSALYYQLKAYKADTSNAYMAYNNLLGIYVNKHQLSKASVAEREVTKRLSQFDADDYLMYLENKIAFAIVRGDNKKAQSSFEEYVQKKKEREENENRKAANEISSLYKTVQKDQQIGALNKNIDKITGQLELNRLWLAVIVLFSGLLFAMILLLFLDRRRKELITENKQVSDLNIKLELEQRLLRSQMDPHFIFNCLASIRALVRQEKTQETLTYLDHFSVLMREKLTAGNQRNIDLKSEVDFLENYLKLQQMRMPGKFDYVFELDNEVANMFDEIEIPAMLLQPFIENSILHGFKNISYKGHIHVSMAIDNEVLKIIINDNGVGLDTTDQPTHTSRATQIVTERIQYLQTEGLGEASLSMNSQVDAPGTIVTLRIPV
jgi:signal transduction histidine kinase